MLLLSHNNLITWNGELHIVLLLAGVEISIGNNKLKSTLNSSKGKSPATALMQSVGSVLPQHSFLRLHW